MSVVRTVDLRVQLLGRVQVHVDGRLVLVRSPLQRAVLAFLALNAGHVVSSARLVDALWGERAPDTVMAALQVHVSGLRKALGPAAQLLATRSPGYVLTIPESNVDVLVFEAAMRAGRDSLEASGGIKWNGEVLSDLPDMAFVPAVTARIQQLRWAFLEDRAEAELDAGRHAAVVDEVEEMLVAQPYRERLWRSLIIALYRSGRQADALAAYRRAACVLADDLGLDPGPALIAVHQAVLTSDPLLLAPTDTHGVARLPEGTTHLAVLLTDIVGSTTLWQRHAATMPTVLARHHDLIEAAVVTEDGHLPLDQGEGDSRLGVFRGDSGVAAAARAGLAIHSALAAEPWPDGLRLQVRIGIDEGEVVVHRGNVFGVVVNRCSRVRGLAHGGQVLLSGVAAAIARPELSEEWRLRLLGRVPLRDFEDEEEVFQLDPAGAPQSFPPLRTLVRLPADVATFVGRDVEVARIVAELGRHRLLTLTGLGGSGKTRLAVQAARVAAPDFPGGVTFVDLGASTTLGEAFDAVAASFRMAAGTTPRRIAEQFAPGSLVLLDNVEQIRGVHALMSELLDGGTAHLLVTSRSPVGLPGEVVRPVEPLSGSDAVTLLLERTADVLPELVLDAVDAVELVRLLDRVPLAIELAAARLRVMDLATLIRTIADQLTALSDSTEGRPQRHRSVTALLSDTWDELNPPGQLLLTVLSSFRAGATVDVAADVAGLDVAELLDPLGELLGRGLVFAKHSPEAGPRFQVLDLVRRFAEQRCDPGVLAKIRRAHALHLVDRVMRDPADATSRERDDLREAIRTITADVAGEDPLELTVEQRLAVGRAALGLGWWAQAVAVLDPIEPSPEAANSLGVALVRRDDPGDTDRGRQLLTEAAMAGDADAAATLGGSYKSTEPDRAYDWYLKALAIDPADPYPLGNVIEHEVLRSGSHDIAQDRRDELLAGIERRRAQAARGEDLPWPWYDMAKFQLLLGDDDDALHCLLQAVATSKHARQLQTTEASLRQLTVPGVSAAWTTATAVLELASVAVFPVNKSSANTTGLAAPVVVLAGASGQSTHEQVMAWLQPLVAALPNPRGTVISGGTSQGVSAVAAMVAAAVPGWRAVGYLPATLPDGVTVDDRYDELIRTDAEYFGLTEPLAYWAELVAAGIAPHDVHVLGIGGGALTRLELHLAAALGAPVAVAAEVQEPGRSSSTEEFAGELGMQRIRLNTEVLRTWLSS